MLRYFYFSFCRNPPPEITPSESITKILSLDELNDTKWRNELPTNLLEKVTSILQKRKPPSFDHYDSNKQLFGGRLPPFIERIIQRIQNYFSVYNPPEYFENNRPPTVENEGITIICSNQANESFSCSDTNAEESPDEDENPEVCDSNSSIIVDPCASDPNSDGCPQTSAQSTQDEYDVVVTHTVVQDNSLNVYSPADATHMVSNVVVILEPSRTEYSAPTENSTRNKFYVYVHPTSGTGANANDRKDEQKIPHQNSAEKRENFPPYINATYAVIIRGDRLEEYSTNIDGIGNESLNPDVAVFAKNSTTNGSKTTLCKSIESSPKINCSQLVKDDSYAPSTELPTSVASRSIGSTISEQTKNNQVPNINLALVPPINQLSKNKSCSPSKNKVTNSLNLEYYILKPDIGGNKIVNNTEKQAYRLQKTYIDNVVSPTYLPPPKNQRFDKVDSQLPQGQTGATQNENVKLPFAIDLLKNQ